MGFSCFLFFFFFFGIEKCKWPRQARGNENRYMKLWVEQKMKEISKLLRATKNSSKSM